MKEKKTDDILKQKNVVHILHNGLAGWIVLVVSLSLTMVAYLVARNLTYEQERKRFDYRSAEIEHAIIDRMRVYEQALHSAVAMAYTHEGEMTRSEWSTFVSTIKVKDNWPGIQGLGYAVLVSPENKEKFEEKIQAEGFPDFTIKPEGDRSEYSSIIYLEPFDWRNQRAFGYDMWSNDMRRAAMKRARDEGSPATSGIITLVQETDTDVQKGFLMYLPVYVSHRIPDLKKDRISEFQGWVYAAFRAKDLLRGILGDVDPSIEFEIFDGETVDEKNLLFDTNDTYSRNTINKKSFFSETKNIELQGRPWIIYLRTPDSYSIYDDNKSSQYVLIGGIIIDILLFYLIYSLFSLNKKAQKLAGEMTIEYRLASEREEQANKAKSQFLATMSHELRTPLNSIIGFSNRLINRISDKVEEREAEGLRAIYRNGQSLLRIINNILDLSAVEAGKVELTISYFDIKKAFAHHLSECQIEAEKKNLLFSYESEDDAYMVYSDSEKLKQIGANLISNAFKYTSEGSVALAIRKAKTKNGDDGVEMTVTDTGMGISKKDIQKLFQSYFRSKEARVQAIQGTGLGLMITSELVELLEGEIHVVSELKKGSCFSIIIPVKHSQAEKDILDD